MATVDLVYDAECPNVALARANLMRAFSQAGLAPAWSEHLGSGPETPAALRGYGSPTVLVDGHDVAGQSPGDAACCRLYPGAQGTQGAPSVDLIAGALARAKAAAAAPAVLGSGGRGAWRSGLAVLPGIGLALLPKVACPACWPAYGGVLSALGLSFLMDTAWLLPLTALFLALAVGALAFRARRRRGFLPFAVGLVAATGVLVGKFAFESDPAMFAGLGLLISASLWNSWPRRSATGAACPACLPPTQGART